MTKKAKHTPGPWKVREATQVRVIFARGGEIARMSRAKHAGPSGNGSNARLIAAAPDLLAACEAALAVIGDFGSGEMETLEDAEEVLISAIAKAKGESDGHTAPRRRGTTARRTRMTTITIQQGTHAPETVRVFGPFDPHQEPTRWFRGDTDWVQCDECCDIYHYEADGAPDDSCLCEPCRTRSMRQRVDDEIDRRREEDAA